MRGGYSGAPVYLIKRIIEVYLTEDNLIEEVKF